MFLLIFLFSSLALIIPPSEQSCQAGFAQTFLAKHNELRAKHGAPALSLANEISASAQKWADHLASTNKFEHSTSKYGENLYCIYGRTDEKGNVSVQAWYNEIKYYNYFGKQPDMDKFEKFGHFTQVVWLASTKLGVGCGVKGDYLVVVGQYQQPGNLIGAFKENVLAPKALAKSPAKASAKSPAKAPAKPPPKAPAKSPPKTPANKPPVSQGAAPGSSGNGNTKPKNPIKPNSKPNKVKPVNNLIRPDYLYNAGPDYVNDDYDDNYSPQVIVPNIAPNIFPNFQFPSLDYAPEYGEGY